MLALKFTPFYLLALSDKSGNFPGIRAPAPVA
jgi:hypothetical protein